MALDTLDWEIWIECFKSLAEAVGYEEIDDESIYQQHYEDGCSPRDTLDHMIQMRNL